LSAERPAWWTSSVPGLVVVVGAAAGLGVGAALGAAPGAMFLGGTVLVGAILAFWSSVRLLLGEDLRGVDLSDEVVERTASDPLFEKKRATLAALADMERERQLGKIEAADYDDVVGPLRAEARAVLKELDARVAPYRARAEQAAADYLAQRAIVPGTSAPAGAEDRPATKLDPDARAEVVATMKSGAEAPVRVACPACGVDNEPDAKFCKGCGKALQESHAS
jgi:hypothetical protein